MFAVFFGLMELIPYLGPFLGALPPILVALFTDPISRRLGALLFVGIQQLEGHIVAPQIFGHTLRINPLLVIFALLLGQQLLRAGRRAAGAPDPLDPARDRALSQSPSDARAVGAHATTGCREREPPSPSGLASAACAEVAKRYGEREALRDVSFDAAPGELVAVVGPNGAGKTTLLSILAGIQRPSSGSVRPGLARSRLGAPAAGALLQAHGRREPRPVRPPGARRRPAGRGRADARADRPAASAPTICWDAFPAATASASTSRSGCSPDPPVLALDEPSTALDPGQRERLWSFIRGLAADGTSVVFSTHDVNEVQRYAARAARARRRRAAVRRLPHSVLAPRPSRRPGARSADFEDAFVSFLRSRGHR